jgi:serine/threonine protein kinase
MQNKYEILTYINKGVYGTIYKAKNKFTDEIVAIKKSKINDQTMINEAKIYNYLNNTEYIPIFKGYFNDTIERNIVLELMDNNIICFKNNLTNDKLKDIFIQLINCIEFLHNKGIVHRDIKPNNFLIKNNIIKICDFGFSKQIIKNKKHIEFKKIDKIIGTPNFISVNVHNLIEPTRRDDIESIIYIIIYLIKDLPWKDNNIEEIINIKNNLLDNEEIDEYLKKIIIIIKKLNFSEIPLYSDIKNIIINEL